MSMVTIKKVVIAPKKLLNAMVQYIIYNVQMIASDIYGRLKILILKLKKISVVQYHLYRHVLIAEKSLVRIFLCSAILSGMEKEPKTNINLEIIFFILKI